jgi:kynureninase
VLGVAVVAAACGGSARHAAVRPGAPPFIWVTPDLCDDGHDCSTATMDAWMAKNMEPVVGSSLSRDHGVVIKTFDGVPPAQRVATVLTAVVEPP